MHSPVDLHESLAHVRDEPSFIRFIEALGVDFASGRLIEKTSPSSVYGPSALGWENVSVDAFFDAAASWADASSRLAQEDRSIPNVWHRCAAILLAGKYYE